jgi:hypothetical protein
MLQRLSCIAWPSFIAAAIAEMVWFALFDPADVAGGAHTLSRTTVYSIAFFAFWGLMAVSSGLTWLLQRSADEINRCPLPPRARPDGCPRQDCGA